MLKSIQIAFVCVLMIFPFYLEAQICENLQDYNALMAIYNANGGDNWTNSLGQAVDWNQDCTDLSEWEGVTTNANGRVTRLKLRGFGMTGILAPQIQNLSFLRVIDFRNNELTGTLPIAIANLPTIKRINLKNNLFEGCIPSEWDALCNLNINFIQLEENPCLANQPTDGSSVFAFYCSDPTCIPAGPDTCPTCTDGITNGDETGVDCGGPDCQPCSALTNVVANSIGLQNGLTAQHVGGEFLVNMSYEVEELDFVPTARVGLYFSADRFWDSSDVFLEDLQMNNLVGEYTFGFGNILNIPLDANPGKGYIIMYVDYLDVLAESNENDNFKFVPIQVLAAVCDDGILNGDEQIADCGGTCPPCELPDVEAIELTIRNGLTEQYQGGDFLVKVKYQINDFGFTENTKVGFYFSEDQVYDEGIDVFLEDISLNNTVGVYEFNFGNVMQIPLDAAPGPAYILMFVDNLKLITETNETNNVAAAPITVLASSCSDGVLNGDEEQIDCGGSCPPCGVPDLVATNFEIQSAESQFYPGDELKFSFGYDLLQADIPSFRKIGYYFTQDPDFDPTNPNHLADPANIYLGQSSINILQGSYNVNLGNLFFIPDEAPPGQAYICYYLDHLEQVAEYNEDNNRIMLPIEIFSSAEFAGRCCQIEIISNDLSSYQSLDDLCNANVTINGGNPNFCTINELLAGHQARQICFTGKFSFSETIDVLRGDVFVLESNTELHYTGGAIAFDMIDAQGAVFRGEDLSSIISMEDGEVLFDIFADPLGTENNNIIFRNLKLINKNATGPVGNNSGGTAIRIENPSDWGCNQNVPDPQGGSNLPGCQITSLDLNRSAYLTRIQDLTIENFHTGIRLIDQANGTLVNNIQMNNVTRYGMYTSGCVDNVFSNIHINNCDSSDGSCSELSVIRIEAHLLPTIQNESYCDHQDDICHLVRPGPAGYFNIFLNTTVGQGVQNELLRDDFEFILAPKCGSTVGFNQGCRINGPDQYYDWFSPWRNRIEFINTIPENDAIIGTFYDNFYSNPQIFPDNYICTFTAPPTSNEICIQDRSLKKTQEEFESSLSVRPNPTAHSIEIYSHSQEENYDLKLFTMDGRIVKDQPNVILPMILNVSEYPNGFYILKLSSDEGYFLTEKIIISK